MQKTYKINLELVGQRIDKALTLLDEYSRTFIKESLDNNRVFVNGKPCKASYKVKLDDEISLEILPSATIDLEPTNLDLDIIYEDQDLAVINKPKGMVVHPANGHVNDTLVSGLLYQLDDLSGINGEIRPGIVHRIDKDTTGLLVVAKNDYAHNFLANQLKDHSLKRKYLALVVGIIKEDRGRINAPIGRNKDDRKKMAVTKDGKEAVTHFKVIERFKNHTLIECVLETGRTHQIRVHMSYINKPILGDPLYGPRKVYGDMGQFLHAYELSFIHPKTKELVSFTAPIPTYFKEELDKLREENK